MKLTKLTIDMENLTDMESEVDSILEVLNNLDIEYETLDDPYEEGVIELIEIKTDNIAMTMWDIIENLDHKYNFQIDAKVEGFRIYPSD